MGMPQLWPADDQILLAQPVLRQIDGHLDGRWIERAGGAASAAFRAETGFVHDGFRAVMDSLRHRAQASIAAPARIEAILDG